MTAQPLPTGLHPAAAAGFEQPMTPDLLVAREASMSFIGALDDGTRAEVLERVHRLGAEQGETFALPYRTDVHLARRE